MLSVKSAAKYLQINVLGMEMDLLSRLRFFVSVLSIVCLVSKASNGKLTIATIFIAFVICRNADKKEVIKAYRKLAREWHPDNFPAENEKKIAEERFIEIAAAKEVLTDPGIPHCV